MITVYTRRTEVGFSNLSIPDGFKCINPNCQLAWHTKDIDDFYQGISNALYDSFEGLNDDRRVSVLIIPEWIDEVKEKHDAAREAYNICYGSIQAMVERVL